MDARVLAAFGWRKTQGASSPSMRWRPANDFPSDRSFCDCRAGFPRCYRRGASAPRVARLRSPAGFMSRGGSIARLWQSEPKESWRTPGAPRPAVGWSLVRKRTQPPGESGHLSAPNEPNRPAFPARNEPNGAGAGLPNEPITKTQPLVMKANWPSVLGAPRRRTVAHPGRTGRIARAQMVSPLERSLPRNEPNRPGPPGSASGPR